MENLLYENLFEKYINLAYKIANKYLINYKEEIEDIRQIALIGLWKASKKFDNSKNIAFLTYANKCIYNEINMYLRKLKKKYKLDIISLDSLIVENRKIEDNLDVKQKLNNSEIERIENELLKDLSPIYKRVYFLLKNTNLTRYEIANYLGLSCSYISKIKIILKDKLKEILNNEVF